MHICFNNSLKYMYYEMKPTWGSLFDAKPNTQNTIFSISIRKQSSIFYQWEGGNIRANNTFSYNYISLLHYYC